MNIDQFDYDLPEQLIAQTPLQDRSASRLLVLDPGTKNITHDTFQNIRNYIQKGDCLVLNNSKVIPVRLYGVKSETGAKLEVLLLQETEKDVWEALVKPAKRVKKGTVIHFHNGKIKATCIEEKEAGARLLKMEYTGVFLQLLDEIGEMPLPPYIKEKLTDRDRYQTIYAEEKGSAAAPTAGLHFTNELLTALKNNGINIAYVTLHVGLGTFRPISVNDIEEHEMHAEYYVLTEENATIINQTKENGGKIIAVGTTSTRVLETVAKKFSGNIEATSGWSNIYIYPPYTFQAIDGLITNFHLPKSSLLLLVSALAGRDLILEAYKVAIERKYRFFSFGDAMFILPKKNRN